MVMEFTFALEFTFSSQPRYLPSYCSHGYVPRGVFVRFLRENPELHGAKLRFVQFLCIAKRVIVYIMPLFGMV